MVLFTGAARVRLFVRALPCAWLVSARVVARFVSGGVLLRASRCARSAVCLSAILGVLRVSIALGEEDAVG